MGYFSSEKISRDKFRGKSICHYEIMKSDVDCKNYNRLDEFMETIKSYSSTARQKVLFSFNGYDKSRELIYIPEVVNYAKALINRYPYFWYFAIPDNSEFFYLALFVNDKNYTIADIPLKRTFHIKLEVEQIQRFITVIATNLNIFGEEIDDIDGSVECLKLWSSKITGMNIK